MDTNNEILDAIEILADKKIGDNITKVLTGICTSVNINKNTCVMNSNGVSSTVQFYGSPPEVNELYRIFVPSNNMSRSFIVVPPKFTVNPNLLDNWYFGNPVNQRGQTEHTGAQNGYFIDRWRLGSYNQTVAVTGNGLHWSTTTGIWCTQILENFDKLIGRMLTLSAIINGVLYSVTGVLNESGSVSMQPVDNMFVELTHDEKGFRFVTYNSPTPTVTILAAKLELGSQQTLAHLENGNWVLNEIPDFGEQMAKCQRYFWRFAPPQYVAGAIAFGIDANTARAMLYLPEQMRTSPTLNLNASSSFFLTGASGDIFDVTVSFVWTNPNSVCVDFKRSGFFEVNAPYFVRGGASSNIDISADL